MFDLQQHIVGRDRRRVRGPEIRRKDADAVGLRERLVVVHLFVLCVQAGEGQCDVEGRVTEIDAAVLAECDDGFAVASGADDAVPDDRSERDARSHDEKVRVRKAGERIARFPFRAEDRLCRGDAVDSGTVADQGLYVSSGCIFEIVFDGIFAVNGVVVRGGDQRKLIVEFYAFRPQLYESGSCPNACGRLQHKTGQQAHNAKQCKSLPLHVSSIPFLKISCYCSL